MGAISLERQVRRQSELGVFSGKKTEDLVMFLDNKNTVTVGDFREGTL